MDEVAAWFERTGAGSSMPSSTGLTYAGDATGAEFQFLEATSPGTRRQALGPLNVPSPRANEALDVIANRRLSRGAGVFRELDAQLS